MLDTLVILSVLAGASPDVCQIPLDEKPTSMVAGRLAMRLPRGAISQHRDLGLMAARPAAEEEERFVIDSGKQRMVVFAEDAMSLAGPDLEAHVRSRQGTGHHEKYASLVEGGTPVVLEIPAPHKVGEDTWYVGRAYVTHADGTVVMVSVYVNEAASKRARACPASVETMLRTVRRGRRTLAVAAGPVELAGVEEGMRVVLEKPAGAVVTTREGDDFFLHTLLVLRPLGEVEQMGIYLGHHPALLTRHDEPGDVVARKGTLAGTDAEWLDNEARGLHEALVKPAGFTSQVHVWTIASDPRGREHARGLPALLRVEPARKGP